MIRWLHEVGKTDQDLTGGKGANLGELLRLRLLVPPGFVITTKAYRAHVDRWGHSVEAFAARPLDPTLTEAVLEAYRQMGAPSVAVRSSATAEDRSDASHAGQQETFLNVSGEEALLSAVRQCWASLWSERAVHYREQRTVDPLTVAMAVVVQQMVQPDSAGVMFTVDPVVRRSNRVLVEAAPGLGEAVVSGSVTGDIYRVERSGGLSVAEQEVRLPGRPVLSDQQVVKLARAGLLLESHFGHPQDVEFAVVGDRIYLLQSRPITTVIDAELEPLPPPIKPDLTQRIMQTVGRERYPIAPKPLDNLFYGVVIEAVTHALRTFGMTASPQEEEELKALVWRETYIGVPRMKPTWRVLRGPRMIIEILARDWQGWWAAGPAVHLAEVSLLPPLESLGDADLVKLCDRIVEVWRTAFRERMLLIGGLAADGWLLGMASLAVGPRRAAAIAAQFQTGLHTATTRTNEALWRLSRAALAHAEVTVAVRRGEFSRLASFPEGQAFLRTFDAFLAEFGHREGTALYLSTPTWRQDPAQVWRLLQGLVAAEAPPVHGDQRHAAAVAEVERRMRWFPWLRSRFLWLVERTRALCMFRENSHFDLTRPLAALQAIAAECGRRLTERGLLEHRADVFYLTYAEVNAWLTGHGPERAAAHHHLARRRATYDVVNERWQRYVFQRARQGSPLKGVPVSGGVVRARARVLRSQADWHKLQPGEIMVCPFTNPSWTPLFVVAAGVVAETGGAGAHAAIVAREYGIPAVMGVVGATNLIADGQAILVDGHTGRISL